MYVWSALLLIIDFAICVAKCLVIDFYVNTKGSFLYCAHFYKEKLYIKLHIFLQASTQNTVNCLNPSERVCGHFHFGGMKYDWV